LQTGLQVGNPNGSLRAVSGHPCTLRRVVGRGAEQAQHGDASGSVVVPTFPRDRFFFTVAHFDNAANPSHAVAQIRANEDWPFAPRDDNAPYRVFFRTDGSLD
jgi:hypothetical protein